MLHYTYQIIKKYGGIIYMENPELYYKLKHEADNVNPLHSIIKLSLIHI